MVMLTGYFTPEEYDKAARQIPVPFVALRGDQNKEKTSQDFEAEHAKLLICWYEIMLAAKNAMEDFLTRFKREGTPAFLPGSSEDLDDLMGMKTWRDYIKLSH